ncbi:MAG: bifunctional aminoglycoside phosphotransferase/ATP-binding protein, partial [Planctomycetota bacterium]
RLEDNLEEIRPFVDGDRGSDAVKRPLSTRLFAHLRRELLAFVDCNRTLLQRRVDQGRIREGHGDLHTANICVPDVGEIVIYDCIEFSHPLRCSDVAADISFLAMDLDMRGDRALGERLVRLYAERAGDPELVSLVRFYKSYFATVRGKVGAIRAADATCPVAARQEAAVEAAGYFGLAAAYLLPPALFLICGLPGTGKSRAARVLASPLGAVVLRSDVVRRELTGRDATERWTGGVDEGPYYPAWTERTYEALRDGARESLAAGRSVIVDATMATRRWRDVFRSLAASLARPCLLLFVTCDEQEVLRRLHERSRTKQASDANARVYRLARDRFETPTAEELDAPRGVRLDAIEAPDELIREVIDRLLEAAEENSQ